MSASDHSGNESARTPPAPRAPIVGAPTIGASPVQAPPGPADGAPGGARRFRLRWQRLAFAAAVLVALWLLLRLFSDILLPFVAAAGIAYFLDPAVAALARRRVPRTAGALLMVLAVMLVSIAFMLLLYPLIEAQVTLLVTNAPGYIHTIQHTGNHLIALLEKRLGPGFVNQKLQDFAGNQASTVFGFLGSAATRVIGSGVALVNILTLLIITPIVAFYLLRDWPTIIRDIDTWLPRAYEGVIRGQAREINRLLAAWIRGQAMCCLFLALFYSIALSIVGLDLGLIVGLTAGLLSFIPYVGTMVGGISAVVLALAQFPGWNGVALVVGVFLVGQGLNDYVIQPRFLGDRLGLPTVWVIFALFAGGAAFGFVGVMLAVPITATLGVFARFWLHRYLESALYLDEG